jgi:hypothetical protein
MAFLSKQMSAGVLALGLVMGSAALVPANAQAIMLPGAGGGGHGAMGGGHGGIGGGGGGHGGIGGGGGGHGAIGGSPGGFGGRGAGGFRGGAGGAGIARGMSPGTIARPAIAAGIARPGVVQRGLGVGRVGGLNVGFNHRHFRGGGNFGYYPYGVPDYSYGYPDYSYGYDDGYDNPYYPAYGYQGSSCRTHYVRVRVRSHHHTHWRTVRRRICR